jgi:SAM-dependent methyltransferase
VGLEYQPLTPVERTIAAHYTTGSLLERIRGGLIELGVDPGSAKPHDLKPVDEFHTGGVEATDALLNLLEITPDTRVLDVGSGIGGTARVIAGRCSARVTGVDLTPMFVETATELSRMVGLGGRTDFIVGNATNLPVGEATFDLALLMHVGMNIPDKLDLFREAHRVLAPQGVFAVYDVMCGPNGMAMRFPVPWSSEASTSFVESEDAYQDAAAAAGFGLLWRRDRTEFARGYFDKLNRQMAERGGAPPLGIHLLMGDTAPRKIENYLAMLDDGRIRPVEMIFRVKP